MGTRNSTIRGGRCAVQEKMDDPVSAGWRHHILKSPQNLRDPHCFSSSNIRTPSMKYVIPWHDSLFWIITYRWSYRVCDSPKCSSDIGNHRPASSFGHFTTSFTHSPFARCWLWWCGAAMRMQSWMMIQAEACSEWQICKLMTALEFSQCYSRSRNRIPEEHKGIKIRDQGEYPGETLRKTECWSSWNF